jgi:hypothetical protein
VYNERGKSIVEWHLWGFISLIGLSQALQVVTPKTHRTKTTDSSICARVLRVIRSHKFPQYGHHEGNFAGAVSRVYLYRCQLTTCSALRFAFAVYKPKLLASEFIH